MELRRRGQRVRKGPITMVWIPDPGAGPPRVAFAIGKRVGNAAERNRLRRRLRAAVAEVQGSGQAIPPGAYQFSAGPSAASLPYQELMSIVASAFGATAATETHS